MAARRVAPAALVRPKLPPARIAPPRPVMGPLILADSVIQALGRRSDLTAMFPFLRLAAVGGPQRGCRCNRTAVSRASLQSETDRIKYALLGLPPERMTLLKGLLRASELIFYVRTPQGVRKETR